MADQNDIRTLASLIKGIEIAMLTTADREGRMRSRPMATQAIEFDGDLWFLTSRASHKIDEIEKWPHVNLAYGKPSSGLFVSVSGKALLIDDPVKKKLLWSDAFKAWFPAGVDDPDLAVLKVVAESAEYWQPPGSASKMLGFLKAIATGKPQKPDAGQNKEVNLRD